VECFYSHFQNNVITHKTTQVSTDIGYSTYQKCC